MIFIFKSDNYAQKVSEIIDKNPQSAYQLIRKLEKVNIIEEITGAQRHRLYLFKEYLKINKTS